MTPETEAAPTTDSDQFAAIHDPLSREANTNELLSELMGEDGTETTEGRSPEATAVSDPTTATVDAAAAQQPTTETVAAEPTVEELLKTAVPLDYTVNGESRKFDGISVIPGQGAIVTEAALPQLRDRLQQAESARADARNLYGKLQEYEAFSFKSGDREYRGREALDRLTVENARLNTAAAQLAAVLENPSRLAELLTFDPQKSEFTLNPASLQLLQRELSLSVRDSEWRARDGLTARQTAAQQQTEQTNQRGTAITNAITHWASQFPELTPDDIARATAHFSRVGSAVVRPATEEEARTAGIKTGELVIDHPLIHEFLSDRASLRKSATVAASTATTVSKENATRLAAARQGKSSGARPATTQREAPKARDRSEEWEEQKARLQSGQWSADND